MQTAKEREDNFRHDLKELLAQHKAEIEITDDGKGYGMHSGICVITMYGEWDEVGNTIAEYTEFQL